MGTPNKVPSNFGKPPNVAELRNCGGPCAAASPECVESTGAAAQQCGGMKPQRQPNKCAFEEACCERGSAKLMPGEHCGLALLAQSFI